MACIISTCENSSKRTGTGISYFSISYEDRDVIYRVAERSDIPYDSYMDSLYKNYKICHEHYTPQQYLVSQKTGSRRLIRGSKPSLNLPRSGERRDEENKAENVPLVPVSIYNVVEIGRASCRERV